MPCTLGRMLCSTLGPIRNLRHTSTMEGPMPQTVNPMQLIANARRSGKYTPHIWRYSYGERPHVVAAYERRRR